MAFLDKSVLEDSSISVSPHKIFSMGDVALHVRVASAILAIILFFFGV